MALDLKSSIAAAAFPAERWRCLTCRRWDCRRTSPPVNTFWGPRGTVQYTRNNFRGKGESLSVTGFAGRLDQRGAFYYIDPNFRWSPVEGDHFLLRRTERRESHLLFAAGTGRLPAAARPRQEQKNTLFLRYNFSQTNLTHVLIQALVPHRGSKCPPVHAWRQLHARHARQCAR